MCIIFVIDVLSSSNSPPISYCPKKSRRSKGHLPNYESIHLLFIIHTILCVKGFINFILIQKILGNDILCHRLQISFAIRKVYFRGFFVSVFTRYRGNTRAVYEETNFGIIQCYISVK